MIITIPVWLLWILGIVGGLIIVVLAIVGGYTIYKVKDWEFWR